MLRPLLPLLTTLALAAPATAAANLVPPPVRAPACHRTTAKPRVIATRTSTRTGTATIFACDRASGHLETLRHGFVGDFGERLPNLGAPAVQGTKVLWSELTGTAKHPRQDLRTADIRRPTRVARRRLGATGRAISLPELDPLQVFALPGGVLAYAVIGDDTSSLVLTRPGHAPRTLATIISGLFTLEDGRTLVWRGDTGYASYDVAPPPRDASGCPVRSRYSTVIRETPEVRITAADYGFGSEGEVVPYRVCWKATGRDDIAFVSDPDILLEDRIAVQGPYVALPEASDNKYQECSGATAYVGVVVLDARTGRKLPSALSSGSGCVLLRQLVVSAAGVPAWIVTGENGAERVEASSRNVLDRDDDGTLSDLAVGPSGGLTWTHDGQPRASSPTP